MYFIMLHIFSNTEKPPIALCLCLWPWGRGPYAPLRVLLPPHTAVLLCVVCLLAYVMYANSATLVVPFAALKTTCHTVLLSLRQLISVVAQ